MNLYETLDETCRLRPQIYKLEEERKHLAIRMN